MRRTLATILCAAVLTFAPRGDERRGPSPARADEAGRVATAHPPRTFLVQAGPRTKALPAEPGLTETLTGSKTVVHYTLAAGPDRAPDAAFATAVRTEVERSLAVLGKSFGAPIPDGPDGLLHVYVKDNSGDLATMVAVPQGGGSKKAACYLIVDAAFPALAGADWEAKLRAVCAHETMHGIVYASNAAVSAWFAEGAATWAEWRVTKSTASLAAFLAQPDSVANRPSLPLWDVTSDRHFSTALFFHYLAATRGIGGISKWLDEVATTDDAMTALVASLGGAAKFQPLFRAYLVALYQRKVKGVPPEAIPAVPQDLLIDKLGAQADAAVAPTGAVFRRVVPDARITNTWLYTEVEAKETGSPEMLAVREPSKSAKIVLARPGAQAVVPGFLSAAETLLVLTDTNAAAETAATTTVDGLVTSPFLRFTAINPDTPISVGETANINISYDLIGVPPSPPIFLIDFVVVRKNGNVIDSATEERFLQTGEGRLYNPVFRTFPGTPTGAYKFKFLGVAPAVSTAPLAAPRSKTTIKTQIDVL